MAKGGLGHPAAPDLVLGLGLAGKQKPIISILLTASIAVKNRWKSRL